MSKGLFLVLCKIIAIPMQLFIAFGIVGPALISSDSYILMAVGFTFVITLSAICILYAGQIIKYFLGKDK